MMRMGFLAIVVVLASAPLLASEVVVEGRTITGSEQVPEAVPVDSVLMRNGATVAPAANVQVYAADHIVLAPGTQIQYGSKFLARIQSTVPAAYQVSVYPSPALMTTSATKSFVASVNYSGSGQAVSPLPTIAWSISGGQTIGSDGVFVSGTSTGSYTVTATASINGHDYVGTSALTVDIARPIVYDRTYVCATNIGYYQRTIEATSPTNAAMTFTVTTAPQHGTLTIEGGTSFKYIPTANYVGPDSFQVAANDGVQGLPGTIRMNVGIDPARSPLVRADAIEAFDPVKWANDADYRAAYLANPNPARVWQTAQGGPGVPMLQIVGSPRVGVQLGGQAMLEVRARPLSPVIFSSDGCLLFESDHTAITVRANELGIAKVSGRFRADGASGSVLVGSTMSAGVVRFSVVGGGL